jgi:hypothetical protein
VDFKRLNSILTMEYMLILAMAAATVLFFIVTVLLDLALPAAEVVVDQVFWIGAAIVVLADLEQYICF